MSSQQPTEIKAEYRNVTMPFLVGTDADSSHPAPLVSHGDSAVTDIVQASSVSRPPARRELPCSSLAVPSHTSGAGASTAGRSPLNFTAAAAGAFQFTCFVQTALYFVTAAEKERCVPVPGAHFTISVADISRNVSVISWRRLLRVIALDSCDKQFTKMLEELPLL